MRRLALMLLLRSLNDAPFAQPKSAGSVLRSQSKSGDAPSLKVPCPNCGGDKQTRRRGIVYPCTRCLSERSGRPLGWIYVDGNIDEAFQRKINTEETGVEQRYVAIRCDACFGSAVAGCHNNGRLCERCNASGWIELPPERLAAARISLEPLGPDVGPVDPALRAMEGRQRLGSYAELATALAELRAAHNSWYRLVIGVYVLAEREDDELANGEHRGLECGMGQLLSMMPEHIRVPSWAARNERRRRDRLKRKAAA